MNVHIYIYPYILIYKHGARIIWSLYEAYVELIEIAEQRYTTSLLATRSSYHW